MVGCNLTRLILDPKTRIGNQVGSVLLSCNPGRVLGKMKVLTVEQLMSTRDNSPPVATIICYKINDLSVNQSSKPNTPDECLFVRVCSFSIKRTN